MDEHEIQHQGLRYVDELLRDLPVDELHHSFKERVANARDMFAGWVSSEYDILLLDKTLSDVAKLAEDFQERRASYAYEDDEELRARGDGYGEAGRELSELIEKSIGLPGRATEPKSL